MIFSLWPWLSGVSRSLHIALNPLKKPSLHCFRLIFQCSAPPPSQTPNRNYYSQGACLFLYSFFSLAETFLCKNLHGGHIVRWVVFFFFLPSCTFAQLIARPSLSPSKHNLPWPPHAKCGIRRIMPMSDFHRRAVVYYRCGKSLFNTFCLCELQKNGAANNAQ